MSRSGKHTKTSRGPGLRKRTISPMLSKRRLRRCRLSSNAIEREDGVECNDGGSMLRLNIDRPEDRPRIRSRIENIYDRIAGSDDYERNSRSLSLIQFCVITASA